MSDEPRFEHEHHGAEELGIRAAELTVELERERLQRGLTLERDKLELDARKAALEQAVTLAVAPGVTYFSGPTDYAVAVASKFYAWLTQGAQS